MGRDALSSTRHPIRVPRILVIEDDVDTAMLLSDAISDHFDDDCVTVASTIRDAKATRFEGFDLVLSDFNLPDGDGLATLEAVKQMMPNLPVIMVTGESEISTAIGAIRAGACDYVVKSPGLLSTIPLTVEKNLEVWRVKQENSRLQIQLERSLQRIQESNEQLSAMVAKLEAMALTDALTSLSNRRHLNRILAQMFAQSARYSSPLSCIMMDVDGFKQLNDSIGHQRGDELLSRVGRIIAANCREADVAIRYGGDEFLVMMPETDRDTAVVLADRLRCEFARMRQGAFADQPRLDVSIGIACTSISRPTSGEALIQHADAALYAAKEAGKARIMLCESDGTTCIPASKVEGAEGAAT